MKTSKTQPLALAALDNNVEIRNALMARLNTLVQNAPVALIHQIIQVLEMAQRDAE